MSSTLHVITNSLGMADWVIVYETGCGEVVYEGHDITPQTLFEILKSTLGAYDDVAYHEFDDEDFQNWSEAIYS